MISWDADAIKSAQEILDGLGQLADRDRKKDQEIEGLRHDRNEIIERCAKIAEAGMIDVAAAIRSLKS